MWELPITFLILVVGLIFIQRKHYEHLTVSQKAAQFNLFSDEIDKRFKDFEDYKKKVDALTLRAGFKL